MEKKSKIIIGVTSTITVLSIVVAIVAIVFLAKSGNKNNGGGDKDEIFLPPEDLRVTAKTKDSLTYSWDNPNDEIQGEIYYDLNLYTDSNGENLFFSKKNIPEESFIFKDLESDTSYWAKVKSHDDKNESGWSELVHGYTEPVDINLLPDLPNHVELPETVNGSGRKWSDKVFAPFVDMGDYMSDTVENFNHAPSLSYLSENSKADHFFLGFITSYGGFKTNKEGKTVLNWAWGGNVRLSPETDIPSGDKYNQFEGINNSIKDFRDKGGDVSISIGGATGTPFWMETKNFEILVNTYEEIIDFYNIKNLDLDIEGLGLDGSDALEANKINAKAIKKVQDDTNIDITLTLPVSEHEGLTEIGEQTVSAYIDAGVKIKFINAMTMVFEDDINGDKNSDLGQLSIDSMDFLAEDLVKLNFPGVDTVEKAYPKMGNISSIGFEREDLTIETPEMFEKIVLEAESKDYGIMSYWAENRNSKIGGYASNTGVSTIGEFSKIANSNFSEIDDPNGQTTYSTPEEVEITNLNADYFSINLNWDIKGNKEDIFYDVYIAEDGDSKYKYAGRTFGNSFTVTELKPSTNYYINIAAVNGKGDFEFINEEKTLLIKTNEYDSNDSEKPVFEQGSEIKLNSEKNKFYTTIYGSFTAAEDNYEIDHYSIDFKNKNDNNKIYNKSVELKNDVWKNSEEIEFSFLSDFTMGSWVSSDDVNTINGGKVNFSPKYDSDYTIEVKAYDLNGNVSDSLKKDFHTDDIPNYNHDDSLWNYYRMGTIINYNDKYYLKVRPWGGFYPDLVNTEDVFASAWEEINNPSAIEQI